MKKIGDLVAELFRERFGAEFMENVQNTADLFSSWKHVIAEVWCHPACGQEHGSELPSEATVAAAHSRIKELRRGVLLVEADHPGWIQILQTKQEDILSAVRRRCPELDIQTIAFRLSRKDRS